MKAFLTTVAGSATRFSESVGKPTLKCIYNTGNEKNTLLYHLIRQAQSYDKFVIVGGFLFEELKEYIETVFPEEWQKKVILYNNEQYADSGSGWSFYCGLKALQANCGNEVEEVLFAEGDLYVDDNSFRNVVSAIKDVITYNHEVIRANKAVALYFDECNSPHYIYDTSHGKLKISEPFTAIYNSGQVWKFRDIDIVYRAMDEISLKEHQGTNLVLINEYFQKVSELGKSIDMIPLATWINCNTASDFTEAEFEGGYLK